MGALVRAEPRAPPGLPSQKVVFVDVFPLKPEKRSEPSERQAAAHTRRHGASLEAQLAQTTVEETFFRQIGQICLRAGDRALRPSVCSEATGRSGGSNTMSRVCFKTFQKTQTSGGSGGKDLIRETRTRVGGSWG